MTMKKIILIIFVFGVSLFTTSRSSAYLSVNESAEILPENYFSLGVAPQAYLSDGGGFDASVFVDAHLFENTDGRITLGGGDVDFWTQASMKWVPFPDVENQPAIGVRGAVAYVRDERQNFYHIQIAPIISKKSTNTFYDMIPYASLPITYIIEDGNNYVASQFALGAMWFPWNVAQIGAEFDLDLKNSRSSASVFFTFPFESGTGYKKY